MVFGDLRLDQRIVDVLSSKGITEPTDIQRQTYTLAVSGNDVIGVSKTGSGKTLAFVLPVLSQILLTDKPFYTLIVTPTRELAQQISDCIALFEGLGVRQAVLIGGEPFSPQVDAINLYPHVVVGTPKRIVKHIEKTKNFKIAHVRKLVLDEADRFFEQDFGAELGAIAAALTQKNQALMFTATLTEKTSKLSTLFMRSPRCVGGAEQYEQVDTLRESVCIVPEKYKLTVLYNYLAREKHGAAIVFVAMCREAQKINAVLAELGLSSDCLHGSMSQSSREEVVKRFRASEFSVLVSTDLAGRGLDIPHVETVVNFDLPNTAKDYVHRVGRTARAGRGGCAVSFVTQYDMVALQSLEHVLKRRLPEQELRLHDGEPRVSEIYARMSVEVNEQMGKKRK
ncbi:ATP-dependent RNA helicase DDX47/RRP3 [Pancytospora philotis]|nr:ATP-dependent RNA helicase DDX47/RRP3 [Pancytospora philotis]